MHRQRKDTDARTAVRHIAIYGLFTSFFLMSVIFSACFFLMSVIFSACDQIQRVVSPAKMDAPIKIGLLYSSPVPGTTRNGAELAVTQLNQEGGVNGIPIQLIAKDDKNDKERSVALAKELIHKEGVLGIIGPDWSVHAWEVTPIAQHYEIPVITTYPTNPAANKAGDFVFMGAFTDIYQGELIAKFAAAFGATTAALLTEEGYFYAEGLAQYFTDNFTSAGGSIVIQQFYTKGDTDFTEQLTAIAAVKPDVVFVPGFLPEVPRIVQQAKDTIGLEATFLGVDGWDDPALIASGGTALEGSFFANHFSAHPEHKLASEDAKQFVAAYTAMFGIPPDGPASLGYDAVRILVQAMHRAEVLTGRNIRDQIAATTGYSGATVLSRYDENRHPIKNGVINIIKDGEIQLHQVFEP